MIANFSVTHPVAFDKFIKENLKIDTFSILPLAGDASSRRYYRVSQGTSTWVLMEWDPFASAKDFPFISIQRHFAESGIEVPRIFAFDQTNGLFLLEDLGDLTLERRFWEFLNQDNILPFYQVCLDKLITLHKLYLKPENRNQCTAYSIAFDVEKFTWEMNYTLKNLFTVFTQNTLNEKELEKLQAEFSSLATTLAGLPQVLCHRDFHSRNVMIKGEKIYFIDFQDARLGPPQYDLVSLLHDSYVNMSDENIQKLLDYYIQQAPTIVGLFKNKQEFMKYFYLQMLQRCFKACGTFAAVYNQRSDQRYLKYLPGTLKKVVFALSQFPEYPMISKLVGQLELPQIEKWP